MGSFLTRCFVSGQTIPEEFPVVLFPVVRKLGSEVILSKSKRKFKARNSSFDGPYNDYDFLGIKIDAIADDYGRQNLIDTPFNRESLVIFYSHLKGGSFNCEKGENPYHEKEYNFDKILSSNKSLADYLALKDSDRKSINIQSIPWKEFKNVWENIQNLERQGRIYLENYSGYPELLHLSICLKSSYDYFVDKFKKNTMIYQIKELSKEGIQTAQKEHPRLFSPYGIRDAISLTRHSSFSHEYFNLIENSIDDHLGSNPSWTVAPADKVLKVLKELQDVYDFCRFCSGISVLNISLTPIQYGSQDYQNEHGIDFADMVKSVQTSTNDFIKKKNQEYGDYDDEIDNEIEEDEE